MKKLFLVLSLLLTAALLASCSGTRTAVTVGKNKIDEAEYAFYLNYNRLAGSTATEEVNIEEAREAALWQIVSNEVVRIKCRELGLTLSKEQKAELAQDKKNFIEILGGKAKYLSYLKDSCLTDRSYDKVAENELYLNMLFDYVCSDENEAYTDEQLRRFFADNYIGVKYIFLSATDDEGELLPFFEMTKIKAQAEEVLKKAQAEDADFDELINQYSDDLFVTGGSEGIIVSRLEAEGQSYLEGAFELAPLAAGGVFEDSTGFYIVKRLPVDASYYEENRSYINDTAQSMRFAELLEGWCNDASVTVKRGVNKITFDNLKKYVR